MNDDSGLAIFAGIALIFALGTALGVYVGPEEKKTRAINYLCGKCTEEISSPDCCGPTKQRMVCTDDGWIQAGGCE